MELSASRPAVSSGVRSRRGPVAVVVGAYLIGRMWQLVMMGPPVVASDSPMYRSPGQAWLDFGAVSWDGSSLRPWPVTVVFALMPNDRARIIAQFVLATLAWSACIYQVGRLPVHPRLAVAAAACVAVLALTRGVSSFDVVILSESVALSLVAVFLAALLQATRNGPRPGSIIVMLLSAWMLALIRPVLLGLLIVPVVVVVARYWSWNPRRWSFDPRRLLRAAALVVPVVLVSGLAMVNVLAYNAASDKTWGDWRSQTGQTGLNGRTIQQWTVIAGASPVFPQLLDQFIAADGAPACLNDTFQQPPPANPPPVCEAGLQWISAHFNADLVKELLEHPKLARDYFVAGWQDVSVQRVVGDSLPTLVPDPISSLAFGDAKGTDPMALWTLLGAAAVLTAIVLRLRAAFNAGLITALLAGYAGLFGTVLLSPTDVSRVGLPVTILLRVLLIVLIVQVIDALRRARTSSRGATTAPTDQFLAPTETAVPVPTERRLPTS